MKSSKIFYIALALAGAVLASSIMVYVSPKNSFLSFMGWIIFFIAIQAPLLFSRSSRQYNCSNWFRKAIRK